MKKSLLILPIGWLPSILAAFLLSSPAGAAAATVEQVWFQEQGPHTRMIIQANQPIASLTIQDQPGTEAMTVVFPGRLAGKSIHRTFNEPNLKGIYIDQQNGKVQIFIKRHFINTVQVKNKGYQLIADIPHAPKTSKASSDANPATLELTRHLAPGVRFWRLSPQTPQGPVQVNILEVNPKQPGIELLPSLAADRMGAKASVAQLVQSNQAIAGINGSFFKPDQGIPLGILIINRELLSGPIYDRVALGITPNNDVLMAQVQLRGHISLPNGRQIPLHNINQPRIDARQTVLYSSRWGPLAPKVPDNGIQIQIRNQRVTAVSRNSPLPIPQDGFVISGVETPDLVRLAQEQHQATNPTAATVNLNIYTLPDWSGMKHALGGGPWLVRNGRIYIDLPAQRFSSKSLGFREPRSAIGLTAQGHILMVTVDGRQKGVSVGMTLPELAALMQKLGAVQAMNLDGGSSTQMAIRGKTVNRPSAGQVVVSNALIIRQTHENSVALQE